MDDHLQCNSESRRVSNDPLDKVLPLFQPQYRSIICVTVSVGVLDTINVRLRLTVKR